MNYDISESVSQRGSGEETPENRRIYEVADELHRRCQLYEAQLRNGQNNVSPSLKYIRAYRYMTFVFVFLRMVLTAWS